MTRLVFFSSCRTVSRILALAALAGALGGCLESPTRPVQDPSLAVASSRADVQDAARPGERDFRSIAELEPGFAGYVLDEGRLVVFSANEGRAGQLRTLMEARRASMGITGRGPDGLRPVEVRTVDFSFAQLKEWRDAASQVVWAVDQVVGLDLDEGRNRVTVRATGDEAEAAVRRLLADLMPSEALHFEIGSPARPSVGHSLPLPDAVAISHHQRPLVGGYIVEFKTPLLEPLPGCTMGFNAKLNGVDVFFTSSHCTEKLYELDGTAAYQHEESIGSDFIAYEYKDPPDFDCDWWPFSPPCRITDAAAFRHMTSQIAFGQIARTQGRQHGVWGSSIIEQSNPRFDIAGELPFPAEGQEVNKLGNGSGWTYGWVDVTCDEQNVGGYKVTCGYRADYYAEDGDSGGPVFTWSGGNEVVLTGIHFASEGNFQGWFSAFGSLEQEFGPLTVYDQPPPPLTVDITGPSEVPDNAWCTWQGFASGGTGSYSYSWSGVLSGSGSVISGQVGASGWLYLTVDDGVSVETDQHYITVDEFAECLE